MLTGSTIIWTMRIRKGTLEDLEALTKLLGRVEADAYYNDDDFYSLSSPSREELSQELEEGRNVLLYENRRILAYFSYTYDMMEAFFPSKGRQMDIEDLLETINYVSDGYVIVKRLAVDPSYKNKGYGLLLLNSMSERFREKVLLGYAYDKSKDLIDIYEAKGFKNHGPYSFKLLDKPEGEYYLFSKRY